ncbi:MAG: porin [Bacteroidia bacterium]
MKRINNKIWLLAILLLPTVLMAQIIEPQAGDTTFYKTLIPETKQTLLKNMSMIANMRFALRNEFTDGEFTGSRFANEQFRLELKGKVHDKVYFRFRDRYTRAQTSESVDNLSRSVDLAFIRVDATDKFSITAGKMCADWGGYEFDANPIDIYEYSDIIEYADNFLSGVGASYKINSNHQATIQILDSRTKTFSELYGAQPNFEESKVPLAAVVNWRGSFFNGKFNTIWAYAFHNEAKNIAKDQAAGMSYLSLGNQLNLGKFKVEYDFNWSQEDLDRSGIISEQVNNAPDTSVNYPYALEKTQYNSHWIHLNYRVNEKVNLALVVMIDLANWQDNVDENYPGFDHHIRTTYGFIPTFEYYPFKDLNLRFYVNYVGRSYQYSDYAQSRLGVKDKNTGRFAIGFVSPLGIF